jgi:hypothetical protein
VAKQALAPGLRLDIQQSCLGTCTYQVNQRFLTDAWPTCSVHSVEALLSALECCGVDNCRIEMEGGGELPTLDGSAMVSLSSQPWHGSITALHSCRVPFTGCALCLVCSVGR